ncbi:MAG TPA: hypothetical protein EYP16_03145 [Candidatus Atribacteria bacterium]|nr:hypothetical protein [Candidatus Atribacteria bacterium]
MKWLSIWWYNLKYLIRHEKLVIIVGTIYSAVLITINLSSYFRGLYIAKTAGESVYDLFTGNVTLIIISVIAAILYTSDIANISYNYIRMRPINPVVYAIIKIVNIWIIISIMTIAIYLSNSLFIGRFTLKYLLIVILILLNISIVTSSIGSLFSDRRTVIIITLAYSGLSTSLHTMFLNNTVASWLKTLSMLAPMYEAIPIIGIVLLMLLIIKELRRNIRA